MNWRRGWFYLEHDVPPSFTSIDDIEEDRETVRTRTEEWTVLIDLPELVVAAHVNGGFWMGWKEAT